MIEKVKEWRLEVDTFINSMHIFLSSREISLVTTNLQQGKMWFGECLGAMGDVSPYPSSGDPGNKEIEPQAEHGYHTIWDGPKMIEHTQVAHVKAMRDRIMLFVQKMDDFVKDHPDMFINKEDTAIHQAWGFAYASYARLNLIQARMWFGAELRRICNQQKYDKSVADGTIGASAGMESLKLY